MSEKKTRLPLQRNQNWKRVKAETEQKKKKTTKNKKNNELLTHILTKHISELNELIYAGVKLVCDKISVPLKNTNRSSNLGWENQLETEKKSKNAKTEE